MNKLGLVLEGGGMRGAYTAGVLNWFLKHEIKFDYVVGISSGALYGSMFTLDKPETLKKSSVDLATDKGNVGWRPLFKEGTIVGYDHMFETVSKQLDYPLEEIDQISETLEIGVYDIAGEKTIWVNQDEIAKHPEFVKAACTLPVFGKAVNIEGKKYMDGGITTMIPLEKSVEHGCTHHIVVTTKSSDYVRKEQKFLEKHFLRFFYRKSPQLVKDFEQRRRVYYEERALIDEFVAKEKAIYLYPTEEVGVSRFGGDLEKFQALYNLAWKDCEANKENLLSFYHNVKG